MTQTPTRSVPLDPALPALGDVLPSAGAPELITRIASQLTGHALDGAGAEVQYVRYRPGKSCVASWAWQTDGGRELIASARISHNERVDKLLAKSKRLVASARALARTAEAPYRYLPEHKLFVQLFPFDLRLDNLVLASDEAWLAERIGANGAKPRDVLVSARPVSYKPWRRCVYRYDVQTANQRTSYYAKAFRDDRGAALLRWHDALHRTPIAARAPWAVPAARRYLPEARLLLFDALDDVTKVRSLLRPALKDVPTKARLLAHVAAAAEGLAALQCAQLADLPTQTPDELVAAFRRDCAGIDAVAPDLARSAQTAIDTLESAARALQPERLVPTHGAFRHDQLLDASGRLIVLDLDTICLSGESADAGNFLGYLDLTAVRRPRLQPVIDECARTFVDALASARITSPEWLAWYRAAAHIKKALRSFFALDPGWPETSERMLGLARATVRETTTA